MRKNEKAVKISASVNCRQNAQMLFITNIPIIG